MFMGQLSRKLRWSKILSVICLLFLMQAAKAEMTREWPNGEDAPVEHVFQDPDTLALVKAALDQDFVLLDQLIASGGDVNARGIGDLTPLFWTVAKHNTDGTRALLERGADPTHVSESGFTVLYLAVLGRDADIVSALLEKGADPNGGTGGLAPILFQSLSHSDPAVFRLLFDAGATVDRTDIWALGFRRRFDDIAFVVESRRLTEDLLDDVVEAMNLSNSRNLPVEEERDRQQALARVARYLESIGRLPANGIDRWQAH